MDFLWPMHDENLWGWGRRGGDATSYSISSCSMVIGNKLAKFEGKCFC